MNGCMEKINILTNFFDITTEHEHSLSCIQKYFDSSCCGLYINNVLSKTRALAIITKEFQNYPEFTNAYSSTVPTTEKVKDAFTYAYKHDRYNPSHADYEHLSERINMNVSEIPQYKEYR